MSTRTATNPAPGYEDDFYAWTQDQAEKLRARRHNEVDWNNVAEEIDSVGGSQKSEVRSRLLVLLQHLLKWQYQPEKRCHSWQSSISERRIHLGGVLTGSPSLKRRPEEALDWAYERARRWASDETGLPIATFPQSCPYAASDALNFGFMPGSPWHPDDLIRD